VSALTSFFLILAISGFTASVVALRRLGQPTGEEYVSTKALIIYAAVLCVGVFILGVFL